MTVKTFGVVARVKAPKHCIGMWVNIYKTESGFHSGGAYHTRRQADNIAKHYRWDCAYTHFTVLRPSQRR